MNIIQWKVTSGCTSLGNGCLSCPSLWEYRENNWDYSAKEHPELIDLPFKITEPTTFLVSLGSDLFHEGVSDKFIEKVFRVMGLNSEHRFEVCTKRAERLEQIADKLVWSDNILVGVGVESKDQAWRIKNLQKVPAKTKYVSFAPILGDMGKLDLTGISIAGGRKEDWGLKRPFNKEWLDNLKIQCEAQNVEWTDALETYSGGA